jgi:hypothetical protein
MFGNVAFHLQCKYEKCPNTLIALPSITCLTAAADINVVVMGGHWACLFLIRENQPFKYGSISIYSAPSIYNFTAIVKVVFQIFYVLTRNVKNYTHYA